MGFKSRWYCEHCNHMILSVEQPEEYECPNYKEHEEDEAIEDLFGDGSQFAGRGKEVTFDYYNDPNDKPITIKYDKAEQKERYRIAYHLRGGSWAGVQPYVWTGDSLAEGQRLCEEAKTRNRKPSEAKYALAEAIKEGR